MKKATAAVIVHENKILIAQRAKDGYWEFPGGKIDMGETPAECVAREIKEELDISITIEKFLGLIEGIYRSSPMRVYAFLSAWTSGKISLNVHRDVKWVDRKEIDDYSLVEEDRVILKQFL